MATDKQAEDAVINAISVNVTQSMNENGETMEHHKMLLLSIIARRLGRIEDGLSPTKPRSSLVS